MCPILRVCKRCWRFICCKPVETPFQLWIEKLEVQHANENTLKLQENLVLDNLDTFDVDIVI